MTKKTFLIEMDDEFSCEQVSTFLKRCSVNNRPDWCPLVEVREIKAISGEDKRVWVEE